MTARVYPSQQQTNLTTIGSLLVTYSEVNETSTISKVQCFVNSVERKLIYDNSDSLYSTFLSNGDIVRILVTTTAEDNEILVTRRDYTTDDQGGDMGIRNTFITGVTGNSPTTLEVTFTATTISLDYNFEYLVTAIVKYPPTPTPTPTPSITPTNTPTPTITPSITPTNTPTNTPTPTPTNTPTGTPTPTPTNIPDGLFVSFELNTDVCLCGGPTGTITPSINIPGVLTNAPIGLYYIPWGSSFGTYQIRNAATTSNLCHTRARSWVGDNGWGSSGSNSQCTVTCSIQGTAPDDFAGSCFSEPFKSIYQIVGGYNKSTYPYDPFKVLHICYDVCPSRNCGDGTQSWDSIDNCIYPTPTPTPTNTPTPTVTPTPTNTPGLTPTNTPTNTVTPTPTRLPIENIINLTDYTGTWTVPIGISSMTVECFGSGGNGGRANVSLFSSCGSTIAGGGGGGGAYVKSTLSVTGGTTYSYQVDGGGLNDYTWFGSTITVAAQSGSDGITPSSCGSRFGNGGVRGLASLSYGDIKYDGGNGADASNATGSGGGGGCAGTTGNGNNASGTTGGALKVNDGGKGGNGRTTLGAGDNGDFVGGGGGGGLCNAITQSGAGGNGSQGLIRIIYFT